MKRNLLILMAVVATAPLLQAADNYVDLQGWGNGTSPKIAAKEVATNLFAQRVILVDESNNAIASFGGGGAATPAGENYIGKVGGTTARVTATFTRPADTTAYASGDLVANSTTAGSVVPMSFSISRATGAGGMIRRIRLRASSTSVTNASFRIHFYTASPTVSNGDNGAWLTNGVANYVGAADVTLDKAFTDGAAGNGVPNSGSEINFTSDTYYAVLEARAAYTPTSAETFTIELEILQN